MRNTFLKGRAVVGLTVHWICDDKLLKERQSDLKDMQVSIRNFMIRLVYSGSFLRNEILASQTLNNKFLALCPSIEIPNVIYCQVSITCNYTVSPACLPVVVSKWLVAS